MKSIVFIMVIVLVYSCTKTVGKRPVAVPLDNNSIPIQQNSNSCAIDTSVAVSYSLTISKIFTQNCLTCHATPGSGGINLDHYEGCAALANNGELISVVDYDPNNIQMPPPPLRRLDSCEIKALNLWIRQGSQNN